MLMRRAFPVRITANILLRKKSFQCYLSSSSSKPLRILFCGADEFSIASLKALYREHIANHNFIKSIDVVCKVGKPYGRGLKRIRQVPITSTAKELSLPLHQIDTFTGWYCPTPGGESINLIIAVSFGLKVPPRLLNGTEYGGINVHPSLLPDFRGAAPIHHALLSRCTTTGITLQTLHPHHFDQGRILLQTPLPGIMIPNPESITPSELTTFLAPQGADLLVQGLKGKVFLTSESCNRDNRESALNRPAPKITPEDSHIMWVSWTAEEVILRHRVVGPLWNKGKTSSGIHKRVIWSSGFTMSDLDLSGYSAGMAVIRPEDSSVYFRTLDGATLEAKYARVEGEETCSARHALIRARMPSYSINEQITIAQGSFI